MPSAGKAHAMHPVGLLAVLVAFTLLAGACLEAPPDERPVRGEPSDTTTSETEPFDAATIEAQPLRAEGVERFAREVTLRVRNLGCGRVVTGSAVAIDGDLLVTNRHVVEGADALEVTTWDGTTMTVAVARAATTHDIAVAEVGGELPNVAPVAAADPEPGDRVLVAGYPGGGGLSLEEGRMVARTSDRLFGADAGALALDVEVAPGSSGGPVLDRDGQLVGVIYALAVEGGRGFAVPVTALQDALEAGDALVDVPECR